MTDSQVRKVRYLDYLIIQYRTDTLDHKIRYI